MKNPIAKDYGASPGKGSPQLGAPVSALKSPATANGGSAISGGGPKARASNEKAKSVGGGEAKTIEHTADGTSVGMVKPARKAQSVTSTRSRRSKYGDPNAEPMGDVHKRNWEAVGSLLIDIATVSYTDVV